MSFKKISIRAVFCLFGFMIAFPVYTFAQGIMADDEKVPANEGSKYSKLTNIEGRNPISLNGKWNIIIDPHDFGIGSWAAIYKDQQPKGKIDFYEYAFNGASFNVPGDFNSQMPELFFYEGTVWYKKTFRYQKNKDKKLFIHFAAVNYKADVFLNSQKIGSHEGGFTPFQFELSNQVKDGENTIIVRVNNQRTKDGIPSLGYDWFNYGGITRDVSLVETPSTYIEDYFIQLEKTAANKINGWVRLGGAKLEQTVTVTIPELGVSYKTKTDKDGLALVSFTARPKLWSPTNPKLYKVQIISTSDQVTEDIGFRNITTKGTKIVLNGKPIFLRGISFHEEIPQELRRAVSLADAKQLLTWAKELGCNFVRLAHYPQSEKIVKLAEQMGLMMWEEVPVYQGIAFGDQKMQQKMNVMLDEMVQRDKNRCGIVIWSLSNETSPGAARNRSIIGMANFVRKIDPTRLITSAFNKVDYAGNTVTISDTLGKSLDVLAVNEYLGWYKAWPTTPAAVKWIAPFDKPLIMSEFGGEALYGNHGPNDVASSWSEEFQEQLYEDQLAMLKNIPFLSGTCPWILADFRSPRRLHPKYQDGLHGMWNRKGLLSDKGERKKAWYVMQKYYLEKSEEK